MADRKLGWRVVGWDGRKFDGRHVVSRIELHRGRGRALKAARDMLGLRSLQPGRKRDPVVHEETPARRAPGKWQPIECYTYRLPAEEDYDETGGVQIETREDLSRVL